MLHFIPIDIIYLLSSINDVNKIEYEKNSLPRS